MGWGTIGRVALKIAMKAAQVQFPAIAEAETTILGPKRGADRAAQVDAVVAAALAAQNLIAPDLIRDDAEFLRGSQMVRDGIVAMYNAARRVAEAHPDAILEPRGGREDAAGAF